MSLEYSPRANKKRPDVSDEQLSDSAISVTSHARSRYLERVNSDSPNPNQQIRRMFRTGVPADTHPGVNRGRARRSGDVLVVYRGRKSAPQVVTVLIDRRESDR